MANKKSFYSWLMGRTNFDNLVGDIAIRVKEDDDINSTMTYNEIFDIVNKKVVFYYRIQSLDDWSREGKVHPKVCLQLALREYNLFMERRELRKYISESYDGYVYFIRDPMIENEVKIGRARDVNKRVSSFNTGRPRNLELITKIYSGNYKDFEKKIHEHFKNDRIKREWFKIEKDRLNEFLDSIYDHIK